VKFYGHVSVRDVDTRQEFTWTAGEEVTAEAYTRRQLNLSRLIHSNYPLNAFTPPPPPP
jgi:hypothetical protein